MKIPIKKYVDDPSLSWEERYQRLDAHHKEETSFMINAINRLEGDVDALKNTDYDLKAEYQNMDRMCDWWFKKHIQGNVKIAELEDAIKKHRDATGHELCWLNDRELWSVLGDAEYPHDTLPVREEFLGQCARYYESRIKDTPYEEPKPKETVK